MSWLDAIDGPSDAQVWAIELESDVLAAEVRLVDAEARLAASPSRAATAAFLQALLDVVDLHDLTDHDKADASDWQVAS